MNRLKREQHVLEGMLIVVAIALAALMYRLDGFKMVILHLFYLPVVLSAFFLGRYRAGILAVFCVITASMVTVLQLDGFAAYTSPIAIGLAVTIWGAILCLTALLVGTLSDERAVQAEELHDAYVGVVEVLSKYLQGGNLQLKARTARVAAMSQEVAFEMRLSAKSIDDVRVAALMQDLGKIEVTTRVISKAMDNLEAKAGKNEHYSFHGTDLVHSLGTVLRSAIPILLSQDTLMPATMPDDQNAPEVPVGAKIIRAVRSFDEFTTTGVGGEVLNPEDAIREMRRDRAAGYDADVLSAIQRVAAVAQSAPPKLAAV